MRNIDYGEIRCTKNLPPNSPALVEGVQEVFVLFKDVAQQYGAWPQDEQEGEADA